MTPPAARPYFDPLGRRVDTPNLSNPSNLKLRGVASVSPGPAAAASAVAPRPPESPRPSYSLMHRSFGRFARVGPGGSAGSTPTKTPPPAAAAAVDR